MRPRPPRPATWRRRRSAPAYATGINPNGSAVCSTDGSALVNLNAANLTGIVPAANLSGNYTININGTATTITGSIADTQVTNLASDLTTAETTAEGVAQGYTQTFASNASNISGGTVNPLYLPSTIVYNNQANSITGNQSITGNLSIAGGKSTLAVPASGYASLNLPAGTLPTTLAPGDVFAVSGADSHLQFIDQGSHTQELAFLSDISSGNAATATTASNLASTTFCASGYATGINPNGSAVCSTDGSALVNLNAANLTGIVPAANLSGS